MLLENEFRQITHSFYEADYEEGLQKLDTLIASHQGHPSLTALLINKALFHSQLSEDQMAISVLEQAIELKPCSYLAYFNLASIQIRNNQDAEAFGNLCCCLSIMHLISAKMTKSLSEVDRALELAENNLEAKILKSLILTSEGRLEQGRAEIMKALSLDPLNLVLRNVAVQICKKIDPEATLADPDLKSSLAYSRRLSPTQKLSPSLDSIEAINEKMVQFNKLYNQLNDSLGSLTQKIPKQTSFQNNLETFMLEKSRISPQLSHKSMIAMLEDDDFFADQSNFQQEMVKSDALVTAESEIRLGYESNANRIQVIEESSAKEEFSVDSGIERDIARPNIYPLKLQTSEISINLLNFSFFRAEDYPPLDSVYCLLFYNNKKLASPSVSCEQGSCVWNKTFQPLLISSSPSPLKLKLYNKSKNSIRDLFLGDFQVLINTADLLRLPLYNLKEEQIGNILLHLQMSV